MTQVVAFTTDKNGKPVAYAQARMCSRLRWVKTNMQDAQVGVATGQYVETEYHPWHPVDCSCRHCGACDECTGSYRNQAS